MRHVYDLHVVLASCNRGEVTGLIREIIQADAMAYGHQFPAYRDDPVRETLKAVESLEFDEHFASVYEEFVRDMVYGRAPAFIVALKAVASIADDLR